MNGTTMTTAIPRTADNSSSSTLLREGDDGVEGDTKSVISSTAGASDTHHSGNNNNNNNLAETEEARLLASAKNDQILCLRVLFVIFWFAAASLLSYAVYKFISNDQTEEFQKSFQLEAEKVLDQFLETIERDLIAMDSFSTSITSFAAATGATFPNVTLPDFAMRGASTRIMLDAGTIFYAPLVSAEDREGWEAYTVEQIRTYPQQFMGETAARFEQDAQFGYPVPDLSGGGGDAPPPTAESPAGGEGRMRYLQQGEEGGNNETQQVPPQQQPPYQPEIFDKDGFKPKIWVPINAVHTALPPGPFAVPFSPLWQTSPLLPTPQLINLDFMKLPSYGKGIQMTLASGETVIHPVTNLVDPNTDADRVKGIADSFIAINQFRHDQTEFADIPLSPFTYPVFETIGSNKTVGVLLTSIYWRTFFTDILPEGTDGVICVMENTANQTFTFRLDGPNVTYIADNDAHDSQYDNLVQAGDVASFIQERASPRNRAYTTVNLNMNSTSYTLRVYPSQAYEDSFVDNKPVLYTVVVALAFVASALFFVLYDFLVERRQSIVMDRAVKSSAVVSSLFPETVRDRLYEEHSTSNNKAAEKKKALKKHGWNTSRNLETMLEEGDGVPKNPLEASDQRGYDANHNVIADEFPETTVMFADLAGFTKWSNGRAPKDVFHLLESVYGAFDKIAAKRRVFKVETIGDCYLAVTGLPKPQPDHAVNMVKFARDCMHKMRDVVKRLENSLGPDILDLDFRVGLHSGPVTAGVIRGDKSRFQLFGDTVNTAARMESNGVVGRIHCSQSTADKLILAGHQGWLKSREGGIEAKGLGRLATYFVEPDAAKSNTVVSQSLHPSDLDEHEGETLGEGGREVRAVPEERAPLPEEYTPPPV